MSVITPNNYSIIRVEDGTTVYRCLDCSTMFSVRHDSEAAMRPSRGHACDLATGVVLGSTFASTPEPTSFLGDAADLLIDIVTSIPTHAADAACSVGDTIGSVAECAADASSGLADVIGDIATSIFD